MDRIRRPVQFKNRYQLTSYSVNTQTEENIVYEASSAVHGDVVIKFTPSQSNFHKEHAYYEHIAPGIMADLIDAVPDYNALVLKTVKPGFQVSVDPENPEIRRFFQKVGQSMIPAHALAGDENVPNVRDEFFKFQKSASEFTFEQTFRTAMENKALKVWETYFENAPKFYLHRDFHKRNLLMSVDGIRAIDARGAYGPKAFEFVIPFIIELRDWPEKLNRPVFDKLFSFFSRLVDADELRAALFFFWVYKMDDYVFHKNDNFKLATWCKRCILELYFNGVDNPADEKTVPQNLEKFS